MPLREACRALITHPTEAAILLGRRSKTDHSSPGEWALFGGKVDEGESPEAAVIREVDEEAGLLFIPRSTFRVHENNGWRTHFFTGEVMGTLDLDSLEHEEADYFTSSELGAVEIAFDHREIILSFMHSLRYKG